MSLRLRVAKRTKNLLVLACLIGVGEAEAEPGVAVNIPETAEQQLTGLCLDLWKSGEKSRRAL